MYIYSADREKIVAGVLEISGKVLNTDSFFIEAALADVAGYIGETIEDGVDGDTPRIPAQIVNGVLVPMTAAKATQGLTSVSMVSEGGSSVTMRENVSGKVDAYKKTLLKYRRLKGLKRND